MNLQNGIIVRRYKILAKIGVSRMSEFFGEYLVLHLRLNGKPGGRI